MSPQALIDGLISYLCLVILITFHEFGHAWMSNRRGDDTAKLLGRISLNPLVHMEMLGTVVLPLLGMYLSATGSGLSSFIIGWGKPVPVNAANLKNRGWDWVLIALAGPAMNIILAFFSVGLIKAGFLAGSQGMVDFCGRLAIMNLMLCFFNLLPIPPLDGSHVMRYFLRISEEAYYNMARYGMIVIIIVIQIPAVRALLRFLTEGVFVLFARIFALPGV